MRIASTAWNSLVRSTLGLDKAIHAASVIVSHNHLSGNAEPSQEDIAITKQLAEAGKILGVPLYDHVIVTEGNGYTSFTERGLI